MLIQIGQLTITTGMLLQLEQLLVTAGIALFAAGVSAIILGAAVAERALFRQVVQSVAVTVGAIPVLGYAVIGMILPLPIGTLPILLPVAICLPALFVSALDSLSSAARAASILSCHSGHTRLRRLILFDVPFAASGVLRGLRLAAPAAFLGVLLGQMFESSGGTLGERISETTRSGNVALMLMFAILPLILAGACVLGLSQIERVVSTYTDISEIRVRSSVGTFYATGVGWRPIACSLLCIVALWWLISLASPDGVTVIKNPFLVTTHFFSSTSGLAFFSPIAITILRVGLCLLISISISYSLAALPRKFKLASGLVTLIAIAVQCVPVILFIPVVLAFIKSRSTAAIIIATLAGLYSILGSLLHSRDEWDSYETHGNLVTDSTWYRREWLLMLPWSIPSLLSGIRMAVPQIFSAEIIAEYLVTGDGIGIALPEASAGGRFLDFWAYITVVFLSVLIFISVISFTERHILRRYYSV